jgi:signal transduction histidine kinase
LRPAGAQPSVGDILGVVVLEPTENSQKLRWLLLGTFGGMLLLMSIAGIDALRSVRKLHEISREVSERYSTRNQALQTVLVCFHVYDEQLEQFLLTDVVVANVPTRENIADKSSEVQSALRHYPQDSGSEERSLLTQINQAVNAEEAAFETTQSWHSGERKRLASIFIEEKIIPTRAQVMTLATAVSHLNHERLTSENQVVTDQFLSLQTRLSRMVFLTLLAGAVLSLAAGYYILRLEQNGRKRYLALVQSRQELEGLSKRLVDVQEAERRSISRELHDEVGQTLGAVLVELGQLSNLISPGDTIVKDQIARIKNAAESAVRSIRDMALLLRPPMLDDLGLIPALEWQARETSRRSDMEVEVEAGELPGNLADELKTGIYRLVQEALQNAATHAHAKTAKVSIKHEGNNVDVQIADDGIGFQPERTRGMGILGMEERVRQLGGTFALHSSPRKGTTVHAVLPLGGMDH